MKSVLKRILLVPGLLLGFAASAQHVSGRYAVDRPVCTRHGDYLDVAMELDLSALDIPSNRALLLTPVLVRGEERAVLPSVGIYGRTRYYQYLRSDEKMLSGADEITLRASEKPDVQPYRAQVAYAEWMNGARLEIEQREYACCKEVLASSSRSFDGYREWVFRPVFRPVRPEGDSVKVRSLDGSAFIDFPVNRTTILADYRGNRGELDKIIATIDSVRNDADVTITCLSIKGFASPEGTYKNNERLAKGRTEALMDYVQQLYRFPAAVARTSYEPEDWAGLRRFVEGSGLEHKAEILALIDGDLRPDAKEAELRRRYPAQYRFLLENCYPALRRSDYRIVYTIRTFSDVRRIKELVKTAPQKLSLQEFYLAARDTEAGSDDYDELFEVAVRMYPEDAAANLNAANAAMARGDLKSAERYLAKAGASPEATYARGLHAALAGDYAAAERRLAEARKSGVAEAADALRQLAERPATNNETNN